MQNRVTGLSHSKGFVKWFPGVVYPSNFIHTFAYSIKSENKFSHLKHLEFIYKYWLDFTIMNIFFYLQLCEQHKNYDSQHCLSGGLFNGHFFRSAEFMIKSITSERRQNTKYEMHKIFGSNWIVIFKYLWNCS